MSFRLRNGQPAIGLAPMEGVTDAPMRAFMAQRGGFTYCVSEFLRVSQEVPPLKTYYEHVPELRSRPGETPGYTPGPRALPIQIQLLGGHPERLAASALRAVQAGAPGVDLNFGCPAPTVNRHDGGATLLKFPLRIREIVEAVRRAVPREFPVSAKLRLGWDDPSVVEENSEMAAQGGADWITIHGRTRLQGYQPPAYWEPIGRVRARLGAIPVVANGDIWTIEDFKRCREETGCEHYMLGRGALADPELPRAVARELGLAQDAASPFSTDPADWIPLLERFVELSLPYVDGPGYVTHRIKQWLRYVHLNRKIAWFDSAKRAQSLPELMATLGG